MFIRESIRAIESLDLPAEDRSHVDFGTAITMLRPKLPREG